MMSVSSLVSHAPPSHRDSLCHPLPPVKSSLKRWESTEAGSRIPIDLVVRKDIPQQDTYSKQTTFIAQPCMGSPSNNDMDRLGRYDGSPEESPVPRPTAEGSKRSLSQSEYQSPSNSWIDKADDEDGPASKKRRLRPNQVAQLEESFAQNPKLNQHRRSELASALDLSPRQIEVWFQNKRAKLKVQNVHEKYEELNQLYQNQIRANQELQKKVATLTQENRELQEARAANQRSAYDRGITPASDDSEFRFAAITGTYGRFLRVTQSMAETLGYTVDELLKLDFMAVTHRDDKSQSMQLYHQLLRGNITEVEWKKRYVTKSGEDLWAKMRVRATTDPNGEPAFICYLAFIVNPHRPGTSSRLIENQNRAGGHGNDHHPNRAMRASPSRLSEVYE
uniref:Homeobox domain-containing protein n=1 Tax=Cyanoptyche gloeocystis TaxID=77922 RepID=A0A7S2NNJ5_9EUKA|mmetsp:Transcript_1161/g.2229  ORF Transcript_1161/g.2229 Transcript_1161/m.2229 type:complete len:393 (+) Transcript_1161:84-1262(+)|eukprot:CAMPEP_0196657062 /NCGR_PEP_ID=MMETSP1086-20130531/21571_1 /TAXON_ID=77921 /ORGANISM="Cyanoptyche  gloeocystis , Strain SAG4.97" /LENGTH=392 /DNA_ID=CAMNT_0041990063 /DNA_START=83 /DNA_END=1261 /DNA_ORIENTATION=+